MTVSNATQFCKLVENVLGWAPTVKGAPWRAYSAEASKVTHKIKTNPDLYTWHNLELAVELCRRERLPRTPVGVMAHVARAVEMAVETEDDVELAIREAVRYETAKGDPAGWAVRFARVHPVLRREVLEEWRRSAR